MLLEFDLAGAEWNVVAFLCRDPAMLDVFRSGKSPHVVTGALMAGVSEDLVLREEELNGKVLDADVIAENRKRLPELSSAAFLPRSMSIRKCGKRSNHACNYHIGYKVFALTNEMEEREAKRIVTSYSSTVYPGLQTWWEHTDDTIRKTRRLSNCFGRTVYFMGQLNDETFKEAYSFVPQSTVAECCLFGQEQMFEDDSADFAPSQLLLQNHDSLLTQYLKHDWRAMARYAIKLGLDYMRPTIDYGEPFKLNTDCKVGRTWGSLIECPLTPDEGLMAARLEEAWEACNAAPRKAA